MDEDALSGIDGIGKNIARKIREIVEKGTFHELEEVKSGIPGTIIEPLNLEGVGPKTVSTLWKKSPSRVWMTWNGKQGDTVSGPSGIRREERGGISEGYCYVP